MAISLMIKIYRPARMVSAHWLKNAMETFYMCLNFQQRKEGKLSDAGSISPLYK